MPYDLFGEIPVTEDEVFQWVVAVAPRWLFPERTYLNYVRSYAVPDKIRAAKLAGTFDKITDAALQLNSFPGAPFHPGLSVFLGIAEPSPSVYRPKTSGSFRYR